MKTYTAYLLFKGTLKVQVNAQTEEEAHDLIMDGEYKQISDESCDYFVENLKVRN